MSREKTYTEFLEVINKALDVEVLYHDAFKIFYKIFNPDYVLLLEKDFLSNELLIKQEYFENNLQSLLSYKIPNFPNDLKENQSGIDTWTYSDISNNILNKYDIFSLIAVELNKSMKNNEFIVLASKNKKFLLIKEDLTFFIKLSSHLTYSSLKIEKYQESISESFKLQNQNSKLREKENIRSAFINNIAHELKTPLASILGFSRLLTSKDLPLKEYKEIAEQIEQAGNRLSSLVNDFLLISKLDTENWTVNYETFNLIALIKEVIDEYSRLSNKHTLINLSCEKEIPIKTDPKLLRQVLDNIISNAIKYSPNGGEVKIEIKKSSENKINILVSDEGIGIDKNEIPKVFNRFYRIRNKTTQLVTGTGLGLSICKEITKSLNGDICIESELNKGTEVKITLQG